MLKMKISSTQVLQRTMPTAISGVNFLSGGQTLVDACARLSAINRQKTKAHPWNISFSWSAAIQLPLFEICRKFNGDLEASLPSMEVLYLEELKLASSASLGVYMRKDREGDHFIGKLGVAE